MTEEEWKAGWVRCLGLRLSGRTLSDVDRYGDPIRDDSFLFCLNPHHEPITFYLPPCSTTCSWHIVLDTREPGKSEMKPMDPGKGYEMAPHSAVLFAEAEAQAKVLRDEEKEEERVRLHRSATLEHVLKG